MSEPDTVIIEPQKPKDSLTPDQAKTLLLKGIVTTTNAFSADSNTLVDMLLVPNAAIDALGLSRERIRPGEAGAIEDPAFRPQARTAYGAFVQGESSMALPLAEVEAKAGVTYEAARGRTPRQL